MPVIAEGPKRVIVNHEAYGQPFCAPHARVGRLSLPMEDAPAFVPVVTEIRYEPEPAPAANGRGVITIEIAGYPCPPHSGS
jgi:hypothetical protein